MSSKYYVWEICKKNYNVTNNATERSKQRTATAQNGDVIWLHVQYGIFLVLAQIILINCLYNAGYIMLC